MPKGGAGAWGAVPKPCPSDPTLTTTRKSHNVQIYLVKVNIEAVIIAAFYIPSIKEKVRLDHGFIRFNLLTERTYARHSSKVS